VRIRQNRKEKEGKKAKTVSNKRRLSFMPRVGSQRCVPKNIICPKRKTLGVKAQRKKNGGVEWWDMGRN